MGACEGAAGRAFQSQCFQHQRAVLNLPSVCSFQGVSSGGQLHCTSKARIFRRPRHELPTSCSRLKSRAPATFHSSNQRPQRCRIGACQAVTGSSKTARSEAGGEADEIPRAVASVLLKVAAGLQAHPAISLPRGLAERSRDASASHVSASPSASGLQGWVSRGGRERLRERRRPLVILTGAVIGLALAVGTALAPALGASNAWALTEESMLFLEAWRVVDRAYVDKTFNGQSWFRYRENVLRSTPFSSRDDTYAVIRSMLATLEDPFTRFLEPEKLRSLRSGTKGAVIGVGLEVGFGNPQGDLVVVSPVSGGPADRAGIAPGDVIRAIDGSPTQGMGLYDAAQRLQGLPGTSVVLLVEHPLPAGGHSSPTTVAMTREKIELNPVTWRVCELPAGGGKVGYIRLSTFNQNSAGAVREAIGQLRQQGSAAFVLDIRNNSGGLFPAGVEIAKMWLEKGVIVYIADSKGVRDIYDTEGEGALATQEPLAVLVNKGTASASEILAGALKDNGRARILGQPTFGKGKIQSVFELSDGAGLAVTVARYETPSHIDIDKVGIAPDQQLPEGIPTGGDAFCACLTDPTADCHLAASLLFSEKQLAAIAGSSGAVAA